MGSAASRGVEVKGRAGPHLWIRLLPLVLIPFLACAGGARRAPRASAVSSPAPSPWAHPFDPALVDQSLSVDSTGTPALLLHRVVRPLSFREVALLVYGDSLWGEPLADLNGAAPDSVLQEGDRVVLAEEADVSRDREEPTIAYDRGTFLAEESRHEEALPYLTRAVALAPGMPEAEYNLGVTRLELRDLDGAVRALQCAALLRPSRKVYRYAYGAALARQGCYREASQEFEAALRLDPGFREARFAMAHVLEQMGERVEAEHQWRLYLQDDSQSAWAEEARRRLGRLWRDQ